MKWIAQGRPTIGSQLSVQLKDQQQMRRASLLKQMKGIQFLTRQGIALLGHKESEGNLKQLKLMWSHEDEVVKTWVKENRYTCYQTVNELLSITIKIIFHCSFQQNKAPLGRYLPHLLPATASGSYPPKLSAPPL